MQFFPSVPLPSHCFQDLAENLFRKERIQSFIDLLTSSDGGEHRLAQRFARQKGRKAHEHFSADLVLCNELSERFLREEGRKRNEVSSVVRHGAFGKPIEHLPAEEGRERNKLPHRIAVLQAFFGKLREPLLRKEGRKRDQFVDSRSAFPFVVCSPAMPRLGFIFVQFVIAISARPILAGIFGRADFSVLDMNATECPAVRRPPAFLPLVVIVVRLVVVQILDGFYNAVLYPNPARRQCGDIDLYVGEDNFGRTMSLLSEWGMVDNLAEATYKHSHFEWDGVTVEIHKLAADPSETSASFAEWERKSMQDTDCKVILDGRSVLVPPPTYNALFIFVHAFHHFMTQGIGLRQLCDLALLLTAKHDEIDSGELLERLRMYKLMKEWDFFCRLCHEDLGMDASMAFSDTCMSDKTLKKAVRLHEFIFSEGNFGTYTKGNGYYFDKPYIVRKTISLYRHNRRYMQRFAIAPGQTVSHYMNTLNSGFRAVLKHK